MHMQCLLISGDRRRKRVCVHVMCVSAEIGEEGEGRKGKEKKKTQREREN